MGKVLRNSLQYENLYSSLCRANGAEMRQSLETAVLFGMIGVTCSGLLFTPAFYTFIPELGRKE
jgi:hypothetical protein